MAGVYESYILLIAPPWLLGAKGKAYLGALGKQLDTELDRAIQSVSARIVSVSPVDALGALGSERKLERYPGETDANYRTRLLQAFTTWTEGGEEVGLLAALNGGFPGPTYSIIENRDWVPSPPDGDTTKWNRFWVVLSGALPWKVNYWGTGGHWGQSGQTWGSTALQAEIELIRSLIKKWKPAHATCQNILIIFAEAQKWGTPPHNWVASGKTWGGVTLTCVGVN